MIKNPVNGLRSDQALRLEGAFSFAVIYSRVLTVVSASRASGKLPKRIQKSSRGMSSKCIKFLFTIAKHLYSDIFEKSYVFQLLSNLIPKTRSRNSSVSIKGNNFNTNMIFQTIWLWKFADFSLWIGLFLWLDDILARHRLEKVQTLLRRS